MRMLKVLVEDTMKVEHAIDSFMLQHERCNIIDCKITSVVGYNDHTIKVAIAIIYE